MELRNLRAFVEVVRQGGFSQAAKTVFATQSTVSKAVKQLEDEIGERLLDRIGHRSSLTTVGDIVYRRAVRILAERDDLMTELEELRGLKRGVLKLGLSPIGGSMLFAKSFATYRKRHPGVDIRLVEHGSNRLEEMLRAGDIEIAASLLPVADEFEWQSVRDEPLVALLPADSALARKSSINLGELKASPFILFEAGFALNRLVLEACRRRSFEPTIGARSSQIDFIAELVGAGLGVAFLPRMIAEQRRYPHVRNVVLSDPQTQWRIVMIWRRGGYLSHPARAWLDLLKASLPRGAAKGT
jgi:DNA-binding transcriptional LysR family regulator